MDGSTEIEVTPDDGVFLRKAPPRGPTEAQTTVKVRRGQDYFRQAVLNNFGGRCGVTGLAVRELLIASHILPWKTHEAERLNVRNGLSLSRLYDAAFDVGLVTFDEKFRLVLSSRLKAEGKHGVVGANFAAYEGEALQLGKDAVLPDEEFLAVRRAKIFKK